MYATKIHTVDLWYWGIISLKKEMEYENLVINFYYAANYQEYKSKLWRL